MTSTRVPLSSGNLTKLFSAKAETPGTELSDFVLTLVE